MTKANRANRVLLIGGGIAGNVAAIALRKLGLVPIVAEAYAAEAEGVGAFLTLAPNGVSGLHELDLDATLLAAGIATPRFAISLGDGRVIAEMSGGTTTTTIRRGDLYRELRQSAVARGVQVVYGKRFVDARREDGVVIARFEDGSEIETDLLVGTDGIHSRVRTTIDAGASALRYLGLLNTGGFAHGVDVKSEPGVLHFSFGRRCFFGWTCHPNGDVWWFANPGRAAEPSRAELAAIAPTAWRAELLELAAPDASPMRAIIEATPEIIGPWPTHDLPRVPTWRRDGMIILGDAAHAASPSSGQGASMAIEDALVLAKCLRDVPDVDAALATYEGLRRARVEAVVAQGRRNGSGKTPGPFGRVVRDLMLRVVMPIVAKRDPMAWIHDHRIAWGTPAAAC